MDRTSHYPQSVSQWLGTRLGNGLVHEESRVVEEVLDGIFGEQCLQLGLWGEANTFGRSRNGWSMRNSPWRMGSTHQASMQAVKSGFAFKCA